LVSRLDIIITCSTYCARLISRTVVKNARTTVNRARPSRSSLEISLSSTACWDLCLLASAQNVPFAMKDALGSFPSQVPFRDARQRPGYHGQGPVTRADPADRYLGRNNNAKWAMMVSHAVLLKTAATRMISQLVVVCATTSETVMTMTRWDPIMTKSRWW